MSYIKESKVEFENLKNAIIKIVDNRLINITMSIYGEMLYTEADELGNELTIHNVDSLSTGFQGLINLVGDIISRFSLINKDISYEQYEGIIIIDELENHLHPIFQKKLPSLLSSIFPKVQFICSIHSPIPLLGALENSVILNINRTSEEGITIERIDQLFEFDKLNPNIILTSPIFGFKDIFPITYDPGSDRISTVDYYNDEIFRKTLKQKLDNYLNEDIK